jgi:teichuronic acid biosynthesis glycosyltransferase TuaH
MKSRDSLENQKSNGTDAVVFVIATAEWESSIKTNKQRIAEGLASHFDVVYVESLGLREPRIRKSDVSRLWRRFRKQFLNVGATSHSRPARLTVVSPKVLPFHRFLLVRVVKIITSYPARPLVLWSFSPLTYGIDDFFDAIIYHSVDFLDSLPNAPGKLIRSEELRLSEVADEVITSSIEIQKKLSSKGIASRYWPNVADVELFAGASAQNPSARSGAIYAGNLTESKLDFDLLFDLVNGGSHLTLAGPFSIDGTSTSKITALLNHENVSYLGTIDQSEVAFAFSNARVGLLPYLLNTHTAGIFPLKYFEYLASGLRVVGTRLPSLEGIVNIQSTWVDRAIFVQTVEDALENDFRLESPSFGPENSWQHRFSQAHDLINEVLYRHG